jgi:hypothetical protein
LELPGAWHLEVLLPMRIKRSVWKAQRAIIMQLLRDDHAETWTPPELGVEASDLDPASVRDGLAMLQVEGVVVAEGGTVCASRCARHLDSLGLLAI